MLFRSCQDMAIYYEVHGEGPPLMLVSGLGGNTGSWYGQVPYFRNYYRTIIFDNRGSGRSSKPPGPYTMEQFAEDALQLLDHLQIREVLAMGLSMGGMICQELTILAPHRVTAVVLGCTHCGGSTRIPPSPHVLDAFINNTGLTQAQIIDKNIPFFFSEGCRANRPEVVATYREAQLQVPLPPDHAFRAQLGAISGFDCCERLSQVKTPALIIAGTEDLLVPPANARRLTHLLPHAQLIEIPGAGHALHAECRDEINALAHDFFQSRLQGKVFP